jgi:FkbM family methyltransferase
VILLMRQKLDLEKAMLLLRLSGYTFSDALLIFAAKISCLLHIIFCKKVGHIHAVGRFLAADVIAKNSYGIFYCRAKNDDLNAISESSEKEVIKYVKKNVKNNFVCVDVGAHIGKYTVLLSKLAGRGGQVIAIEAHPKNFEVLRKNIQLNNLKNVFAVNVAASNKKAKIKLYETPSSLGPSGVTKRKKFIVVFTDTLDSILKRIGVKHVDFIKVDVEGMEAFVFKGARKTLSRNKNLQIIFEAWDDNYLKNCQKILNKFGYKISELMPTMYLAQRV